MRIAGERIQAELAVTDAAHERGLSGRVQLKKDEGMLFVFVQPGIHSFWMKDMNFPIDIIWINEDAEIVYIKKDARPESFPESYGPGEDVPTESRGSSTVKAVGTKYVLEVVSGFSEENNLREGDRVEFIYR